MDTPPLAVLFRNARIFDRTNAECREGMEVLIEGSVIREVSDRPIKVSDAHRIEVGGRTLMPGLIDAHIHASFSDMNWQRVDVAGPAYRTAHAVRMLGHALDCGFTTVRDIGGGNSLGVLSRSVDPAARYLYAGKMLSMTGGHGDTCLMNESEHSQGYCSCGGDASALCVVVDGVDACIKAAREELRRGAHCIKFMASGRVSDRSDLDESVPGG